MLFNYSCYYLYWTNFFLYYLEGRVRITQYVITPLNKIFTDWKIIQALVIVKKRLIIDNFSIFSNFYYLMIFFKNLIYYECFFFFNIESLKLSLNLINFKDSILLFLLIY